MKRRSSGSPLSLTRDSLSGADHLQLLVFFIYSHSFTLQMVGVLPSSIYVTSTILLVLISGGRLFLTKNSNYRSFSKTAFTFVLASVLLIIVSTFSQLFHHTSPNDNALRESLYLILPVLIAYLLVNTSSPRVLDLYMYLLLSRCVLYFFTAYDLSLAALGEIDIAAFFSPFETSFAHDLFVFVLYFTVRRNRLTTIISYAFLILAMKRASFLLAPFLVVADLFRPYLLSTITNVTRVKRRIIAIAFISPWIMMFLYSARADTLFLSLTGFSVNELTTGRQSIYSLAEATVKSTPGFGSLNIALSETAFSFYSTTWNGVLHNDTIRVLFEVGVVGLAIYSLALASLVGRTKFSAVITSYALFVLVTSHLITTMSFWVVAMLAVASIEKLSCVDPDGTRVLSADDVSDTRFDHDMRS